MAKSLTDWMLETHGVPADAKDQAWLTIEPNKVDRVVFNRTGAGRHKNQVYQNPTFPWVKIIQKYKGKAVFIGLPQEYEEFKTLFVNDDDVPYYPTADLYEAAKVISGLTLSS